MSDRASGPRGFGRRVWVAAAGLLSGCGTPIVKPEALDPEVLARRPLPAELVTNAPDGERVVAADARWLATDCRGRLVFAKYRPTDAPARFCLVLACEPAANRLSLLPLAKDETPLAALASPERRRELQSLASAGAGPGAFEVALDQALAERQLGPPVPQPRRILAVAANFPSHLEVDLDIPREVHGRIAQTPPRVFQKYPPVSPPGATLSPHHPAIEVLGPFDVVRYPERIQLPADELGRSPQVGTNLDYEAEVGVVLGRDLTWDEVKDAGDDVIRAAIAGYVLISDVKARNPQVFERALSRDDSPSRWSKPYLTGDGSVDMLLGNWDEATCAWWGYAASVGEVVTIGPWFVAADGERALPPRALLCARSYGTSDERGTSLPKGRSPDRFYVRQCAMVTEDESHHEAMLWTVPEIVRSALDPRSALAFTGESRQLHAGDVIALGTPGGIVLTVRKRGFYRFLSRVLFWWDAIDWHDAFFGRDQELYLHQGDQVFLWGEGLGCQVLSLRAVPEPPIQAEPAK